jgi:endonuclease/exonuclease/phosphatase (EEP) superfamily protein YafD
MLWCVFAIAAAAPLIADSDYRADLVANLAAQFLMLTLVLVLLGVLLRRRWLVVLTIVLCVVHLRVLGAGAGRAAVWPVDPCDEREAVAERTAAGVVRVMQFNAGGSKCSDDVLDDIRDWQPDILAVCELSPTMLAMRKRLFDATEQPSDATRPKQTWSEYCIAYLGRRVGADPSEQDMIIGNVAVISRWPMTKFDAGLGGDVGSAVVCVVVDGPPPIGRFVVLALHPHSPRTPERWLMGNQIVGAARAAAERARAAGLPVIMLGDMNSTPGGARSRAINGSGLRRAKPLMRLAGTWPTDDGANADWAGWWPLTIAIDDAWISDEWSVRGWSLSESRGSDHWPVIADLARKSDKN